MIIKLEKFGRVLTSRTSGKEAYAAFLPTLRSIDDGEEIKVDFEGVSVLAPGWADEFLTQLYNKFGTRIILSNTSNPSVQATLEFLAELEAGKFEVVS